MEEKTVLVIDTDIETIQMIESTLESEGYDVFIASSKEASIATAKKVSPSIIYVNIAIGGLSGLEVSKAIHEIESLKNIPIIIITPHGATIEPRYTLLYGIVDFLKKPFSPEELISKTIDVLEMNFLTAEPIEATSAGPVIGPAEEEINIQSVQAESVKERPPATSFEEEFVIEPIEKDAERVKERDFDLKEDVIQDVQKDIPEDITAKIKPEDRTAQETVEEKKEKIISEEPEEILTESSDTSSEQEEFSQFRKSKLPPEKGKKLFLFVLVLVLIGTLATGIIYYKDLILDMLSGAPVQVKPSQPLQQPVAKPEPARQPAGTTATAVKPEPVQQEVPKQAKEKTKPVESPAPVVKPADKPVHVQIGVFKNRQNAESLTKKYKELGYDAFTLESSIEKKGIMHRVLIGNFKNKKEASQLADKIRTKEKINAVIFRD
ncbi:MAG: response regulator [Nitrospira sp.]|nr:response regulator [Nitrospira sp.]